MTLTHVRTETGAPASHKRIGEAARLVGVSPSALRLWERQGLVTPQRTQARYRLYSEADLRRLRHVRRLRHEDRMNAAGIRRLIGASSASVASLHRLTSAYGTTVAELFAAGARSPRRVVRAGKRPALELGEAAVRIEHLRSDAGMLEPQLFSIAAGASSEGSYAHDGEEFLFVLSGALTVWVGDRERYRLREGDALSFPSTLPHRWRNHVDRETRLLWINTPPTF
jgi:DNA-binding transcriptional MerR regulator